MFCDITCGRPMTAPTGWHKQLLCCARASFVVYCTNCLHERGARHSPTSRYMQLLCCARATYVVHCTNCLHERGARHSPTSRYMQLLCCARASFVVHCTNCLHELKLSVSYIIMDRAARGAVSARRIRLPRVAV